MKTKSILKFLSLFALVLVFLASCKQEEYRLGPLNAPTNLEITTTIAGVDAQNPNGDGSGLVDIKATSEGAMTYRIAFTEVEDLTASPSFEVMPKGEMTKRFSTLGDVKYRITVMAYGAGGTSTVATKDITVKSVYDPDPEIVANLTGGASKTWVIDRASAGHIGVGPYNASSVTPEWYASTPNEKAEVAPCFYSASFTFTQTGPTTFTMKSTTPDGAFTKTGSLSGITGIPASGEEGCYPYPGGESPFAFVGASSGVDASVSRQTSIMLSGNSTFIGYGATKKEYEILSISDTAMHLRVQGTETGNAWYLKLVAVE